MMRRALAPLQKLEKKFNAESRRSGALQSTAMTASTRAHMQVDNMTLLTMTDCFMTNNTLWYFRTKNEDGEEEGSAVQLDFESATPVYLQHSSGTWLSQHVPEKKARHVTSYYDDMRDVYAGVYARLFHACIIACPHVYVSSDALACIRIFIHTTTYTHTYMRTCDRHAEGADIHGLALAFESRHEIHGRDLTPLQTPQARRILHGVTQGGLSVNARWR
jgi:hypothetical protein